MTFGPGVSAPGAPTHARHGQRPAQNPSSDSFSDRFHVPPQVVCARQRDAVALLDRRSGRYVTLAGVGSRIWDLVVTGVAMGEISDRLEAEYDVPRERLEVDVGQALAQLLAGRFIERGPPRGSPVPRGKARGRPSKAAKDGTLQVPSVLRCGFAIFTVKRSLRTRGFDRTLAWIRRRVDAVAPAVRADADAVRRAERAVATAGAFYPGRALCLEQSLALYLVLRSQGVAVKYCQGVQFHPFQAHAWVEYEGEVVNDVSPHVKHFARFPDQLP